MDTLITSHYIALVDDHVLLRKGLCQLVGQFDNYNLLFDADNGNDFISKINPAQLPELVLMDINMPGMDGFEATTWLKENYPEVKVLALSMYDSESSIIRMFKAGARGYILKDTDPKELKQAMHAILTKGYYYSEMVTGSLIHSIHRGKKNNHPDDPTQGMTKKEFEFLKLVCTEMTYKEIADKMFHSPRTIDGYRDNLFEKLNVRTRVGLVLFAIKNGIVMI